MPWRLGLLQRVLLLALIAQALTGCGKAREAVVEKAQLDLAQKYHDGRKVAALIQPDLL